MKATFTIRDEKGKVICQGHCFNGHVGNTVENAEQEIKKCITMQIFLDKATR